MKVKNEVDSDHCEQEFFTDITSVTIVAVKFFVLGWPSHIQMIENLRESSKTTVDYTFLRRIFPFWRRRSLLQFLAHYEAYDAVHHDKASAVQGPSDQEKLVKEVVKEIEKRLSVYTGVPVPTSAELIMEAKRLEVIGVKGRVRRYQRQLAQEKDELARKQTSKLIKQLRADPRMTLPDPQTLVVRDTVAADPTTSRPTSSPAGPPLLPPTIRPTSISKSPVPPPPSSGASTEWTPGPPGLRTQNESFLF